MSRGLASPKYHLHADTDDVISRAKAKDSSVAAGASSNATELWKRAGNHLGRTLSTGHYQDPLNVASREHMTDVDCFDGAQARTGLEALSKNSESNEEIDGEKDADLITVHPAIDSRLKDVGRS